MKKLILILFIVNCSLPIVISQWQQLPNLPVNGTVKDMWFANANTGWVSLTSPNNLIKTTNGGLNWFNQAANDNSFAVIQFFNDTLGYSKSFFDSGNFRISRTTNGGTNWNTIYTTGNSLADMFFVNKDTGWVCGYDGFNDRIWRTTDGGVSFQSQYSNPGGGLNRIFMLKEKVNGEYYGWVLASTVVYKTSNSGFNWTLINNLGGGCQTGYDIYFKDTANGIITRNLSCFSLTTNGGYNWVNKYEFASVNSAIGVGDSSIAWLTMGTTDTLMKTTNFFQTYGKQVTVAFANAIFALDTLTVFAGRNQVNMMKTTNGGGPLVGIEQISSILPDKYFLGQNYPNPFNPQTTVEFSVSKTAYVTMVIYDLLGKEVSIVLNNEYITSGTYKAILDFNKINASSGVYLYKLSINDEHSGILFTETKKMVFLK